MERQARESGICPVREELFSQCFDEIIRQVTLDNPERGNELFFFCNINCRLTSFKSER